MAISLYDVSVASFLQTLGGVAGFLERGLAHCQDNNIDPQEIVEAPVEEAVAEVVKEVVEELVSDAVKAAIADVVERQQQRAAGGQDVVQVRVPEPVTEPVSLPPFHWK